MGSAELWNDTGSENTLPPAITRQGFRVLLISFDGFALSTTRPASSPGSKLPRRVSAPTIAAPRSVAKRVDQVLTCAVLMNGSRY